MTVEAFSAGGYPIRESDRASGIISTGYRHRNWLAAALLGQERTMISASIGEVSGGTEVTLTITVQEREGRTWQAEGMRTSQIEETYDEWFDRIRAQL